MDNYYYLASTAAHSRPLLASDKTGRVVAAGRGFQADTGREYVKCVDFAYGERDEGYISDATSTGVGHRSWGWSEASDGEQESLTLSSDSGPMDEVDGMEVDEVDTSHGNIGMLTPPFPQDHGLRKRKREEESGGSPHRGMMANPFFSTAGRKRQCVWNQGPGCEMRGPVRMPSPGTEQLEDLAACVLGSATEEQEVSVLFRQMM